MTTMRTAIGFLFLIAASRSQAQQYVISTYAGGAPPPTPAPGINIPVEGGGTLGVATDAAGNTYFTSFNCIFKLHQSGIVTRIAGTSRPGYSGDDGPATSARLHLVEKLSVGNSGAALPAQLAVDIASNLYIADNGNNRVRKISVDGIITTVAGNGVAGFSGDGGLATDARLSDIGGLAVDLAGNLFISDPMNNRVRQVSAGGIITTVAGTGATGFLGDGRPASAASLWCPLGLALDTAGNLLIADSRNGRIRKVSPDGLITTTAGKGTPGFSDAFALGEPTSVASDQVGNLFITRTTVDDYDGDFVQTVLKVSPAGAVSTVAGTGARCNWNILTGDCDFTLGDGRPATGAVLHGPLGLALDSIGNLFIAEPRDRRVRNVSQNGIITSVVGTPSASLAGDGRPATNANLFFPRGVAVDSTGNLFISVSYDQRIRKVSPQGIITTVAGNGTVGFSGDGGPATNAQLSYPYGVAVDRAGNVFVGDVVNGVRKISTDGIIGTIVAAPGTEYMYEVAVDSEGTVFFSDFSAHIRKVSPDGSVTMAATGYSPAVDGTGNLFFVSASFSQVLRLSPDGRITTVAGNGTRGFSGDGGLATDAQLDANAVAVDGAGSIFISDGKNNLIRKVSPDGIITTIAGDGTRGYSGDDGPATKASISTPFSLSVDGSGNIYFAEAYNNAVRVLRPETRRR